VADAKGIIRTRRTLAMPFRLWFYATKIFIPLMLLSFLPVIFFRNHLASAVQATATGLVVVLGITGAVMGVLMVMGRLRMRCPFCGQSGAAGGNSRMGIFMICERCGLVRGGGPLNLRIVREDLPEDDPGS
jgi:uncharacterized MnhB-related membrane protein